MSFSNVLAQKFVDSLDEFVNEALTEISDFSPRELKQEIKALHTRFKSLDEENVAKIGDKYDEVQSNLKELDKTYNAYFVCQSEVSHREEADDDEDDYHDQIQWAEQDAQAARGTLENTISWTNTLLPRLHVLLGTTKPDLGDE